MQGGWNPNAGAPAGQQPGQQPGPQGGFGAPGQQPGFGAPGQQPGAPAGGFGAPGQGGFPPPGGGYPQQQGGFPPPPSGGGGGFPQMPTSFGDAKALLRAGFIGSLFDLSFSNFVATKLAKVLYVLAIIGSVLMMFASMYHGLDRAFLDDYYTDVSEGLLQIALSPIGCVLGIIMARMMTELLVVQFRIMETLQEINHKTEKKD